MSNGNKEEESTTTTSSPPGSLMSDIMQGLKNLTGRKKREQEAQSISAEGGNPCHYQTHVGDDKMKGKRQPRKTSKTCHHGK